jgi:hypothetical protein
MKELTEKTFAFWEWKQLKHHLNLEFDSWTQKLSYKNRYRINSWLENKWFHSLSYWQKDTLLNGFSKNIKYSSNIKKTKVKIEHCSSISTKCS